MSSLLVASSNLRPSDARTAYLNGQSPEKQAEMIARADRVGPGKDDADWLVALAASDAASRIEAAVKQVEATAAAGAMGEKERAALFEQLANLQSTVDGLKAQKAAQPAIPADLSSSMARLAEQLRYAAAQRTDPFANAARYFFVFWAGAGACEAMFFAANYRWLPPALDNLGTFVLGLSATALVLLWLWIAPMLSRNRRF